METSRTPLGIDSSADLSRVARVRGLVERHALMRDIGRSGEAALVELTGGAGWGKTAAAIHYAASRQRDGIETHFLTEESDELPRAGTGARLYIVDAPGIPPQTTDALLAELQSVDDIRVLVCARGGHEILDRAHREGLVSLRLDLTDFPLTPDEFRDMAAQRGVRLSAATADYAAPALAGWPVVAARFIRLCAGRPANLSLSALDALVSQSFEQILAEFVGAKNLPLLVRTSLGASLPSHAAAAGEDGSVDALFSRLDELGLGEWRAA